jgi:hypothetical protein
MAGSKKWRRKKGREKTGAGHLFKNLNKPPFIQKS